MKKIVLLFEYFCTPIWIYNDSNNMSLSENVSVSSLPISKKLKNEITELDIIFQSTYNEDYPPEPKPISPNIELAFCKRILETSQNLKKELLQKYKFEFNDLIWQNRIKQLVSENPQI